MANSSILIISDLHCPYHHPHAFDFLKALKKKYKPDRVVCIGDEIDNHAASYHDSDPDLMSAGHELLQAQKDLKTLEKIFPKMDLLESNHGSMFYRKSKTYGLPAFALKTYNQLWDVKDWKWHNELTIKMSDGNQVYFHHGKTKNGLKLSQAMGISSVQGHYHSEAIVQLWGNQASLKFSMMVGCLIDTESLAMAYGKNHMARPVLSSGIIINGQARVIPMILDKKRNWTGVIP